MRPIWALAGVLVVLGACGSEASSSATTGATGVSTTVAATPTTSAQARLTFWKVQSGETPSADATSFVASVSSVQCGGGPISTASVSHERDRIVVALAQDSWPGPQTCEDRPKETFVVDIGEPINGRKLVDGTCLQDPVPA
jgi:hypothetical protein